MENYEALLDYLNANDSQQASILLGLKEVERLAGGKLPAAARKLVGWWRKPDRAWWSAGWQATARFSDGTVTFTRVERHQNLEELRPRVKHTVMSLVESAGISVEEWKIASGKDVAEPSKNPNYCYNWSFGSPQRGYVLCVWHKNLISVKGQVVFPCDIGSHTRTLSAELGRSGLTDSRRQRLLQQRERSEAFEAAVSTSYSSGKPVRLILNEEEFRESDAVAEEAAVVSRRELDTSDWYIHSLNNGDALIVRGVTRPDLQSQENSPENPPSDPGKDDEWREAQIRVRRGQADFRKRLLTAYETRCAVTGTAMPDLLEAAHIIPHAEMTDFRENNGLLLRADIHTLYDLHHLSVDEKGRVHLSREARAIPIYADLEGKEILFTKSLAASPSPTNLASRHARFLAREGERLQRT